MKKVYSLIGVAVVIAGVIVLAWLSFPLKDSPKPLLCTQELKVCPDGSTVSRMGPNCEFQECPFVKPPVSSPESNLNEVTLGVGGVSDVSGVNITVNKLVQDSRCPQDVKCFWAGAVVVNVTLVSGGTTETMDISTVRKSVFGGKNISIVGVYPRSKKLEEIIPESTYRFTFKVVSSVD